MKLNDANDNPQGASRLAKHMAILGLDRGHVADGELASERRLMAEVTPRRLHLPVTPVRSPAARLSWQWAVGGSLAAAVAVVMLVVLRPPSEAPPAYQMKGGSSLALAVEEHGEVRAWSGGTPLAAGTKIKVQVTAVEPTVAFWGAASRDHRLLTDRGWIWQNRLTLAAGDKAQFGGSLELDGASEGETLVVVVCPQSAVAGLRKDDLTDRVTELVTAFGGSGGGPLALCQTRAFSLRP